MALDLISAVCYHYYMTITRTTETEYAVVTDTVLADGSLKADYFMRLDGDTLRTITRPGFIHVGFPFTVKLGPVSLAAVQALSVGATYRSTK